MMNMLEEAIIYATVLHQGLVRRLGKMPSILHPLEVSQILATMTDDQELITAGVLHNVVEETDATLSQVEQRFGKRVADLVESDTEPDFPDESNAETWMRRKEEGLRVLFNSRDIAVKMLWLADKLANIRSLARGYSEMGDAVWDEFDQKDTELQLWYYKTVAEYVEYDLIRTGAYKEFIKHINFMWPGTFAKEKTRYKKYREVSVDGCKLIGKGAMGSVYRYNDELIIKVYRDGITYQGVEREIEISRKAFVAGLPTAISFGIVAVGNGYGSMFELIDSTSLSERIAKAPGKVRYFAKMMADLALQIHDTELDDDNFPNSEVMVKDWVKRGLSREDPALAKRTLALIDALPETRKLIHGDFHTGNVLFQNDEPLMIDLDRLSLGHPIVDLSGIYMAYIAFGEEDPGKVEDFMGFSYETSKQFYRSFMEYYLGTEDDKIIQEVTDKAALLCYMRMIGQVRKKSRLSDQDRKKIEKLIEKTRMCLDRVDSLLLPNIPK